ncbi:MAG: YcxB family protein [Dehalococcoidales bacterium]|nr:YcxB family protein [Dehalococcoidales bacterium]
MNTEVLNIECELNTDDLTALSCYYIQNSLKLKRVIGSKQSRYTVAIMCLIIGAISLIKGITSDLSVWLWVGVGVIIFGVISLLGYLYITKYWRNNIRKNVDKMYVQGKSDDIGAHKYSISSDGIHETARFSSSKTKWDVVEDIVQTDKHAFILIYPRKAYIIPKRAFPDGSTFDKFVQDVKVIFQTSKTNG